MNVAIIEDEKPAIALLTSYIQRTKHLTLDASFTDPMDALGYYNQPHPPELTFLDVDMPGINGIDLARIIRAKTNIILTTSYRKYGPEAFDLSLCDYLLKPFSFERFLVAVDKAGTIQQLSQKGPPDYFYVRTTVRGNYRRIDIRTILFVESRDNLVRFTLFSETVIAPHTLTELTAWLPSFQFHRVHRSFIVNLAEVHAIDHGQLHMKNGTAIPVGRQYREVLMRQLEAYIIGNRP
jgi:two-component system, LytTR family, response regulator